MTQVATGRGVTLDELVRAHVAGQVHGDGTTVVTGVRHDSRAVEPGDLFVAVSGARVDGVRFVPQALERGAAAVLCERPLPIEVPQLLTRGARAALGRAAHAVYGRPTEQLQVVGITGTNGKTTVAWLLEAALAAAGARPALMGTVAARGPGIEDAAPLTTPEGDEVARFARRVLDAGATHLVMEVSSHGLVQHRVDAVRFRVAAFTNLTQDHLDFHGDLESYFRAKARLFTELQPGAAVVNVDDPFGARLASEVRVPVWRCSRRPDADAELRVVEHRFGRDGIRARIATPEGDVALHSPLLGEHNLENLLVALGCGLALGQGAGPWARGLGEAPPAPGRLERVLHPGDVAVLVDYAHTPDALERALAALRPVTPGRLMVVFGCGGDRDRGKRPRMGEAAGRGADLCVLTSDNPRSESPSSILAEIEPGVQSCGQPQLDGALDDAARGYLVVEERRDAIRTAIGAARAGDTVLIAGKGHETYQVVGDRVRDFDDRQQARDAIAAAGRGGA